MAEQSSKTLGWIVIIALLTPIAIIYAIVTWIGKQDPAEDQLNWGESATFVAEEGGVQIAAKVTRVYRPVDQETDDVSDARVATDMRLRNVGSKTASVGTVDATLVDSARQAHKPVSSSGGGSIEQGKAVSVTYLFEVDEEREIAWLRYSLAGAEPAEWDLTEATVEEDVATPEPSTPEPDRPPVTVPSRSVPAFCGELEDYELAKPSVTVPGFVGMRLDVAESRAGEIGLDAFSADMYGEEIYRTSNWVVTAQLPEPGEVVPYACNIAFVVERIDTGL